MSDLGIKERAAIVRREEQATEPLHWVYLSFADEEFKGGVVIEAHGIIDAVTRCNMLGINPGGEVMCFDVDPENLLAEKFRNRLINKAEMTDAFGEWKTLGELEDEEALDV